MHIRSDFMRERYSHNILTSEMRKGQQKLLALVN